MSLLPRFPHSCYSIEHVSIILLLLFTTFCVYDSYSWHFLPLPWYSNSYAKPDTNNLVKSSEMFKSNDNANVNDIVTNQMSSNINDHSSVLNNVAYTGKLTTSARASSASTNVTNRARTNVTVNSGSKNDTNITSLPNTNRSTTIINNNIIASTLSYSLQSTAIPLQSKLKPSPEILSLKRLEKGLMFARKSLRKVVLEKNASRELQQASDQDTEYTPWGPIYRDASIFKQSYAEMEKRFKVFVYPDGEEPLVHNGPCKDIYSTEGRFIQALQMDTNPFVTKDPFQAHVFFLPFSVTKMVTYLYKPDSRDMTPLMHFVKDYVDVISSRYAFWNRSAGSDHFMLSCHDWGPYVTRSHTELQNNAIRVLCNANSSEGFVPYKDASLPEINLVGGYIPTKLGGPNMNERPYLAFFAGQNHGPVRPVLFNHWEGKDDNIKVFVKVPAQFNYHDLMKKTKFCLCPGGFEVNSPRIVEAIYNDCIPVVIADGFVLPFNDVLDWDAFSLRIAEADIPRLKDILESVPQDKYEAMQERVRLVRRHFVLNQPPQRYDLVHMILHSVWLRRLNIRLSYYSI